MPGPQDPSDQAAGAYGRSHDPARRPDLSDGPTDRPDRGSLTDLRHRLERLPPGHPSSPYHDDGSRKPPVIRLKDLELPLRGDAGTTEAEAHEAEAHEAEAHEAEAHEAEADEGQANGAYADDARAGDAHAREAKVTETGRAGPSRSETDTTGNHPREISVSDTGLHEAGPREAGQRETDSPEADPYGTGQADAAQNAPGWPAGTAKGAASDRSRTWADGSWEWKGERLTSGQCKIADEMLGRCRAAEGRTVFGTYGDSGLTPAMRRVEAQLEHGWLVPETEKFALKSADRFKEKLAKLIADEPGAEPTDLAADIPDAVRFTYLFTEDGYTDGVWQVHSGLENQGYQLELRRNSWENDEYKGINSRWRDQVNGQLFEVQFHTELSWEAKQRTHEAYEGISAASTPTSEKEQLRAYQREVSASVSVPPGSLDISNYRKDD